jgi:hypothetical protein
MPRDLPTAILTDTPCWNGLVAYSCCYCIKADRTSQLSSRLLFTTLRTRQLPAPAGKNDCHARGFLEGQRPGIFVIVMNRFFRIFPSMDCVRMTKTCHSEEYNRGRPTKSLKRLIIPTRPVQVSALEPALTAQYYRLHPFISYRGA